MKNLRIHPFALLFFALSIFVVSCNDDDEIMEENEEELITTVIVELTNGSTTETLRFTDIDGPGGSDPTTVGATLAANTTYQLSTMFLNESETPAEDITIEVREEDEEHAVLYTVSGVQATVATTDVDGDGNPLGLEGTLTTTDAGSGTLQVILRHEPTKTATSITGGSTDADVTFPITVQ
jgi:hypothetical protein